METKRERRGEESNVFTLSAGFVCGQMERQRCSFVVDAPYINLSCEYNLIFAHQSTKKSATLDKILSLRRRPDPIVHARSDLKAFGDRGDDSTHTPMNGLEWCTRACAIPFLMRMMSEQ